MKFKLDLGIFGIFSGKSFACGKYNRFFEQKEKKYQQINLGFLF
jgi:hypothetical protein